tara:strand:- start:247 stop:459 length:213 start_codon:yes stop_codon:yes gene_type:complete
VRESDTKAGCFNFEYTDTLKVIRNHSYNLSSHPKVLMDFFLLILRHCVYPFYEVDEARISKAANSSYLAC